MCCRDAGVSGLWFGRGAGGKLLLPGSSGHQVPWPGQQALFVLPGCVQYCAGRRGCAAPVKGETSMVSMASWETLRSLKSLEEDSVARLSYLFEHLHLLSSDSFSSTLSASALLCFSSVHIRKFDFSTSFDNVIKTLPKLEFRSGPY